MAIALLVTLQNAPVFPSPAVVIVSPQSIRNGIKCLDSFLSLQVIPHFLLHFCIRSLQKCLHHLGLLPENFLLLSFPVQSRIQLAHDYVHPVKRIKIGSVHILQIDFPVPSELTLQNSVLSLCGGPFDELSAVYAKQDVKFPAYFVQFSAQIHIFHNVQHHFRVRRKAYLQNISQADGLTEIDKSTSPQNAQHKAVRSGVRTHHLQNPVIHLIPAHGIGNFIQLQPGSPL